MPHDDFAVEPIRGLPELPPEGERILWQGKPDWLSLAWDSLSLGWVAGYFVLLALWRFVSIVDLFPLGQAIWLSVPFLLLGLIAVAILMVMAWVFAVTTVYTITNRRVAMRIGAALTVTLNLPYTKIANANFVKRRFGTGTIALELMDDGTRLSYLVCWPHVRPWVMKRTQPALRCIPDAEKVAALLADAAEARVSIPQVAPIATPAPGPVAPSPVAAE